MNLSTVSTPIRHITLCTHLYGGAGIGSYRRTKNLRRYTDLNAKLYVLSGPRHYEDSGFVEYLLSAQEWQVFWKNYVDNSHLPLKDLPGYKAQEFFANWLSTNESKWNFILDEADILHLHWNNALFNFKNSSLSAFNKPIVWTFADMYWFTGGCHYSEGCEGYKSNCSPCPLLGGDKDIAKLNWEKKFNFFRSLKNVSIICPSKWLADKAKESSILNGFDIQVINNPNDEDLKPYNSKAAKIKLNIGLDKYNMLVGASAHNNKRKGMDILNRTLQILEKDASLLDTLKITTYGNSAIDSKFEVQALGRFLNPQEQQLIFSAADFYCFTSRAENSPLVVQESLQFGTPVVGFDVGNVSDVLSGDISGDVVKHIDADSLACAIQTYIKTHLHNSTSWERLIGSTRRANEFFNSYNSICKHIDLFSSKLNVNTISIRKSPLLNSNVSGCIPTPTALSQESATQNSNNHKCDVQQLYIDLQSPLIQSLVDKYPSNINNQEDFARQLPNSFFEFIIDSVLLKNNTLGLNRDILIQLVIHLKTSCPQHITRFSCCLYDFPSTQGVSQDKPTFSSGNDFFSNLFEDLIQNSICDSNIIFDDNIFWVVSNTSTQITVNESLKLINYCSASNLIITKFSRANIIERKFISLLDNHFRVEQYTESAFIHLARQSECDQSLLSLSLNSNIIFPLFNNHAQLDKLLESLSRTLEDLEFLNHKVNIIMSDASPDLQLSKSLYHSNIDKRFTFICNNLPSTAFWSESIAKGILFSRQVYCDFLMISNVDVTLAKDSMFNMIEALNIRSNTNALVTCCASSLNTNSPVTVGALFDPETSHVFQPIDSRIFLNKSHPLKEIVVQNNNSQSVNLSACFGYFTGLSFTADQITNQLLPNYTKLPHYWGDTEWSLRLFKKYGFSIDLISNINVKVDDSDESTGDHRNTLDAKKLLFSPRSNDNLVYLASALDLLKEYFPSTDSFTNYCMMLFDRKFQKVQN